MDGLKWVTKIFRQGTLDNEIFFLIFFNFKLVVNKKFHWKGGSCEPHNVSKHSCEVFLSLLLETQTITKQQFDPPARWMPLINFREERENVNSDHSWVSFFFDN